jgi:RHS repeat-associated protein
VDQILAEEDVDGGTPELVKWTLTDHLNTVRDIARYDSQTDTTTVVNHLVYDTYGNVTSETNSAVDSLFLFTARPLDPDTGLQNNLNRWYDPSVGRWLSEDPMSYGAGDNNLCRYVRNAVTAKTDRTGLWGAAVHNTATTAWARALGYTPAAAAAIGAADEATDSYTGGTSPLPWWAFGDQDYHFDGTRGTGVDTRLQILNACITAAKALATTARAAVSDSSRIAQLIGTGLHAIQDWVAHADYGFSAAAGAAITNYHNSSSPQKTFGPPGGYPDDPTLDVQGSPTGRATRGYLTVVGLGAEWACYVKGSKRLALTRWITEAVLRDFRAFLSGDLAVRPDVQNYFLGTTSR